MLACLLLAELRRKKKIGPGSRSLVPALYMDCRKGWIYNQDMMAEAEMKTTAFEKEAPTESCWPAVLMLKPCRWEIKMTLMASSTAV